MKLENQVCSLKLSKKLKKLEVKQESVWMWVKYELFKKPQLWRSDLATDVKITCLSGKREYAYSAFTATELGKRLPAYIDYENGLVSKLSKEKIHKLEFEGSISKYLENCFQLTITKWIDGGFKAEYRRKHKKPHKRLLGTQHVPQFSCLYGHLFSVL